MYEVSKSVIEKGNDVGVYNKSRYLVASIIIIV